MIKSGLKMVGSMALGGIIAYSLTYNFKAVEIKSGVDTLKDLAVKTKVELHEKDLELKKVEEILKDLDGTGTAEKVNFLKGENERLKKEIEKIKNLSDKNLDKQTKELEKANAEIEKANTEQEEILNYINQAINEVNK